MRRCGAYHMQHGKLCSGIGVKLGLHSILLFPFLVVGQTSVIDRGKLIREHRERYVTDYYEVDPVVFGEGRFGYIQRAICLNTGNMRAIKTIEKYGRKYVKEVHDEISILKQMVRD